MPRRFAELIHVAEDGSVEGSIDDATGSVRIDGTTARPVRYWLRGIADGRAEVAVVVGQQRELPLPVALRLPGEEAFAQKDEQATENRERSPERVSVPHSLRGVDHGRSIITGGGISRDESRWRFMAIGSRVSA